MAVILADHSTVYAGFGNTAEWVKKTYDFAVDAGVATTYDVLTAGEDLVILDFYADIETAVTSTSTLVLSLGTTAPSATTNLLSSVDKSLLTINSVHAQGTRANVKLTAAGIIRMTIGTTAATAGKINMWFKLKRM